MCLYEHMLCMCGAHRGQKRVWNPLELELKEVMSARLSRRVVNTLNCTQ